MDAHTQLSGDPVQEEAVPAVPESAESTEQPAESAAQPAESAEQPAESAEQPAESAVQSAESAEQSAESTEQPAESAVQPAESAVQSAESAEQPAESTEQTQSGKESWINDLLELAGALLVSVFAVMLVFTYIFGVADVEGDSMVPTLHDEDRLLILRPIFGTDYETGDLLILRSTLSYTFDKNGNLIHGAGLGKRIVKRLIASGGQEIRIDFSSGTVYVDGTALDEPYLTKRDEGAFTYPFTVPEGYVFVMGDNRNISKDSRHPDVGLIPVDDIVGEVLFRMLPFDRFGGVF